MSKKKLLKNIISVSGLQFANYVIPLITVPYVVRILGPEKYGLVSFASAYVAYFTLLVNYGFDLTATRKIAQNRSDKEKLTEIFSTVLIAKCVLFVLSSLLFGLFFFLLPKTQDDPWLYLISFIINIGFVFFPTWYFQGTGELFKSTIFNFLLKIIFTITIFFFVRTQSDYYFIPLISSVGQILIGIAALGYIVKIQKLSLCFIPLRDIGNILIETFLVFVSTIMISLYTLSNTVLLGFLSTDEQVGYFSASYKVVTVIIGLTITPITQTLYPHFGELFTERLKTKEERSLHITRMVIMMGIINMIVSLCIYLFSPIVLSVLFGGQFIVAEQSLHILASLPFIISLSNVFGIQGMLNLKMDKEFFFITAIGAVICVVLNIFLIPLYQQRGPAIAWLLTEIFITLASFSALRYHGYNIFAKQHLIKIANAKYV